MQVFPSLVSIPTIVLPLVMGSLFLGPRPLPWFVVYNMVLLTLALPKVPSFNGRAVFTVGVIFLLAFIIMLTSFRRSRLGIAGSMGESMLAELSDRIQGQGVLPELPRPVARRVGDPVRGRHALRGRLLRGRRRRDRPARRRRWSTSPGKGDRAGTRALLLAGAMGGLVTAVEPGGVPAGGQRLPDQPPLAGRLRDRRPPQPRPRQRRLPDLDRRPPAGAPLAGRRRAVDARWSPRARCSG